MQIDEQWISVGTEIQKKQLRAIRQTGSLNAAARELGINRRTLQRVVETCKKRAATQGYSPEHDMTRMAPDTHIVKGVSSYYNREGKLSGQWVKTDLDKEARLKIMRELIEDAAESLPALPAVPKPKSRQSDLCTLYTMTDAHVGMHAWEKQGGANWNLDIAEEVLTQCFFYLIDAAPDSETGIIAQLGDLLHYDGLLPVTPTSKHVLDASGGFSEMAHVAVRVLRRVIERALKKHDKVVLVMAEGNHDMASSVWLRIMFKALFEKEPRIKIVDSELPYYAYQHGKVMLGWHHSHMKKMDQLPLLMAAQFPEIWGQTTMRFFHTGDMHHSHEKEYSGAIVTQHPTLAAKDAYAARHGWHALRTSTAVTYHKQRGRVSTVTVSPETVGF